MPYTQTGKPEFLENFDIINKSRHQECLLISLDWLVITSQICSYPIALSRKLFYIDNNNFLCFPLLFISVYWRLRLITALLLRHVRLTQKQSRRNLAVFNLNFQHEFVNSHLQPPCLQPNIVLFLCSCCCIWDFLSNCDFHPFCYFLEICLHAFSVSL